MSFAPVIPLDGLAGWAFLKRTRETQQAAFEKSPALTRETRAFAERIGAVRTAEDLVSDRALLKVALGAFGLQADLGSRFFIRQVLEQGTEPGALATRLSDKRYREMTEAFGFGRPGLPQTAKPGFAQKIIAAYQARSFEEAVGEASPDMRLALGLERDLTALASRDASEATRWYTLIGTPPLRQVFETAFGLPKAFGTLDVDRQVGILQERTRAAFGSDALSRFAEPGAREDLTRLFLARAQIAAGAQGQSSAQIALTLLGGR